MQQQLVPTVLALILSLSLASHAQGVSSNGPETFAKLFVDAINSKSLVQRQALLHPKSRACINTQTQPYYDWIFSRQLKRTIPVGVYRVKVEALSGKPLPSPDGRSDYPLQPSHQLEIDFDTAPRSSTSIILLIVRDGEGWHEVLPCPRPEAIAEIQSMAKKRAEQDRNVQTLVAGLADPLRSELKALVEQGRRLDAIKKYAEKTGADLATAKAVVDALVSK